MFETFVVTVNEWIAGGTAIAGLHTLEEGGLRTTLINAVEAATNRSKELGEMMINNFQNSASTYTGKF